MKFDNPGELTKAKNLIIAAKKSYFKDISGLECIALVDALNWLSECLVKYEEGERETSPPVVKKKKKKEV